MPRRATPQQTKPSRAPARRKGAGRRRRSGEILDAAARVFAQHGYHGATTQQIADLLGIRQASLYYYFPSKEVALEIVCMQGVEDFHERARAIASGAGSAAEKIAALVRAHLMPLLDTADYVRVFLNERQYLPRTSRRRIAKWSRGIERVIADVVKDGVRRGEFRPDVNPRLATLALLGMLNAVSTWYGKENASLERISSEYVGLAISALANPKARAR
ncbi:MAG: TetR family transcriptional regulator [Xanthobacteraceae bacterium]|nr:TetR family transcriptional regulator [Xanthobacteraceae bacterium]